jgi:hypothetical protein
MATLAIGAYLHVIEVNNSNETTEKTVLQNRKPQFQYFSLNICKLWYNRGYNCLHTWLWFLVTMVFSDNSNWSNSSCQLCDNSRHRRAHGCTAWRGEIGDGTSNRWHVRRLSVCWVNLLSKPVRLLMEASCYAIKINIIHQIKSLDRECSIITSVIARWMVAIRKAWVTPTLK